MEPYEESKSTQILEKKMQGLMHVAILFQLGVDARSNSSISTRG